VYQHYYSRSERAKQGVAQQDTRRLLNERPHAVTGQFLGLGLHWLEASMSQYDWECGRKSGHGQKDEQRCDVFSVSLKLAKDLAACSSLQARHDWEHNQHNCLGLHRRICVWHCCGITSLPGATSLPGFCLTLSVAWVCLALSCLELHSSSCAQP
jgi:hypothetical protein